MMKRLWIAVIWAVVSLGPENAHASSDQVANPIAFLEQRVGPLWIASGSLPALDAKVYETVVPRRAVQVTNYRVKPNGSQVQTLRGLYVWQPDKGRVEHIAVFSDGGVVRDAYYLSEASMQRAVMGLTYVPKGGRQSFEWRSTEGIETDGSLFEIAEMKTADGAWQDMGRTDYIAFDATDDPKTLAQYFQTMIIKDE